MEGVHHSQGDGIHHGGGSRVADPHREEKGGETQGKKHPCFFMTDRFYRQDRESQPPVKGVDTHGPGEDEAAQKEHDDGIGEGSKSVLDRSDFKDGDQDRHKQSCDGDRDALCDPKDNDEQKDSQKSVSLGIVGEKRGKINSKKEKRAAQESEFLSGFHVTTF